MNTQAPEQDLLALADSVQETPAQEASAQTTDGRLVRSFRDPAGFVFRVDGRVFRAIEPSAFETLQAFLESTPARRMIDRGLLVKTWPCSAIPAASPIDENIPRGYRLVEHESIPIPSFPAEWCPEMLAAAGHLTLNLAQEILVSGWRLKDATPHNILFRGPNPVFIDVLSFERRNPQEAIWPAYAQFVRTFLLPLLAARDLLSPLDQIWLKHRDGLEPEQVYRALPWTRRLRPPALTLASLPKWFAMRAAADVELYRARPVDPERAAFALQSMLRGLRKTLAGLSSPRATSDWNEYLSTQTHYSAEQFAAKELFVESAFARYAPRHVLDAGANTGHFSERAARCGASVVAIDSDAAAVSTLWRRASDAKLDILPLRADLCRPTPALGWRNEECSSLLDRLRGKFDMVMMLAVVHHMLITERIPLEEIFSLASELTTNLLLIEFVEPEDPMFRQLARGRDVLYAHLRTPYFERACGRHFEILRKLVIPGSNRTLYLLRRKS